MDGLDGVSHLAGRRWYTPILLCSDGHEDAAHRHVDAHEKLDVRLAECQMFGSPDLQKSGVGRRTHTAAEEVKDKTKLEEQASKSGIFRCNTLQQS